MISSAQFLLRVLWRNVPDVLVHQQCDDASERYCGILKDLFILLNVFFDAFHNGVWCLLFKRLP